MSLQCRTGDIWEDRDWLERSRLVELELTKAVDLCCRNDDGFLAPPLIARILRVYSPHFNLLQFRRKRQAQELFAELGNPLDECRKSQPLWDEATAQNLIDELSAILHGAIAEWSEGSMLSPSIEFVTQLLAQQIIAFRYLKFHRDGARFRPGFYGAG
jgi:hypothetical protein